jgi:hypothetical protein
MKLAELSAIMKLMNTHGITQLEMDGIKLACPNPKPPSIKQILSVTPEETEDLQLPQPTKPKEKSVEEIEDDLLFYHEKFDINGDI